MLFLPELTARREQLNDETKKHLEILEGQVRDLGEQLKKANPAKSSDDQSKPSPTAKRSRSSKRVRERNGMQKSRER